MTPTGTALAGLLVLSGALGLVIGSFLNVVVHRVPAGMSLSRPGSACPACGHPVRPYDNVPVLSWLALRGRCRDCRTAIPVRYPLVEVLTGVLFVACALRFEWSFLTLAAWALVAGGLALAVIDLEHQRLPFSITGVVAIVVVLAMVGHVVVDGPGVLPRTAFSTLLWVAVYGGVWLLTAGRGMGLGDVALAPVLGLSLGWVGWGASLVGLLGGFVLGALVGAALLVLRRAARRSRVPHGPFMLAGAFLGAAVGDVLFAAYLRWFGLA